MKRFMNKKVATIGLAAGLALGAAGAAFAFFTSTGAGDGTATTGSATQWTVSVTGDNTSLDLVPVPAPGGTGPSDTESYTITNASAGQQNLAQAVISISSVDAGPVTGPNACTAGDFSLGGNAVGTSFTQTIGVNEAGTSPGPAGVYNGSVSLQLVDNGLNQDQCQGATVHLHVAAS
jgi:hypothetical protein